MRRYLRFGLKTLFLAVTFLCALLAWHVHTTQRQAEAVAAIQRLGGWVNYDFQIKSDKFDPNGKSWAPEWALASLGYDFFHPVVKVSLVYNDDSGKRFDNQQTTDEALAYIGRLTKTEVLFLHKGQATDDGLRHVRRLKKLRTILMWDVANVSDAGIAHIQNLSSLTYIHCSNAMLTDESLRIFGQMPQLEGLSLQGNRFTDAGLAHLSRLSNLTSLWIGLGNSPITDSGLKHLHGLKQLKTVDLQRTSVTNDGMAALRAVIPTIRIVH